MKTKKMFVRINRFSIFPHFLLASRHEKYQKIQKKINLSNNQQKHKKIKTTCSVITIGADLDTCCNVIKDIMKHFDKVSEVRNRFHITGVGLRILFVIQLFK